MICHASELCTWNLFRQMMANVTVKCQSIWRMKFALSELTSEYTSHEICQTRCHNLYNIRQNTCQNTCSGLHYINICYNWHQPTTCEIMCQSTCQDRWQSSYVSQYVSGYMSNYQSEISHVRVCVRIFLAEYIIIMWMSCQSFCQDTIWLFNVAMENHHV